MEAADGVGGPLKTFLCDYSNYVKSKTRSETAVQEVRGGNEESLTRTNKALKNARASRMLNKDMESNEKNHGGLLPIVVSLYECHNERMSDNVGKCQLIWRMCFPRERVTYLRSFHLP